ncbi:inverse autotransporter adhesin-like protein YeeJ [Escherichia coli]|uniref:Inverse autotransporter adhesin-like protein YeeJ n=9 Tax=Escherichia coli TaxID=562 RepID=A0A793CHQ6_ECOLX|nr:inverse autotransporter adhesin-like protein YeeJ [Escherichia coli]EEY4452517.1 inverse autotransporter adhesin-like protein YeeJ [Escherichia coli O130]EKH5369125.1 inverse autotransporter adhesin-like protein YeeJ [Escherichia coli O33]ELB9666898.1 inverse autotransporter adhesin-like protein YeeJ [Escherichia coli O26]EEQ7661450.1 inverse autotransporter adhesin-like protein YeeJ [Escherichia coli]EEQ9440495.1 inverse autotransporter adhesin-like protein YeeJ [Escherichia coli]
MATKKRSGEEINDRQILCGMGIKLRRLTAGICLVTQLVFPMAAAAQGVVNAATQQPVPAQIAIANANTVPYTLGALESAQSVAERFGISVAELRKLNQFRTFARGFDNVRQGDELDVPAQVSKKNLTPPPGNSSDNLEQQIASTSQQIGSLLAEDMNSEQAANMARGWASSQTSGAMTDWLSRFGTARITLGVDEDFSLKNSQFDFLHPWYETPDNLFFSQHTLHRTDERTQINNGLGWRHFTPTWLSGINFFFDHDLSRYHSRAGIGAEYWRDYLKLSSNGYLRLTNWRSAPELDNDYEARPANGWDVRAEGWLPAWPHLGGKLVYEQYYGDEVALFDKDDRQSNPHAITAGLNYTPFPLMTFSAEQRQGKQGENDTRFAVDFTWQPGSAMQKQLDPNEVAARRSLAGSRYDLVDRNNNIVLEYRKKELVRLTLTDPVTGKSGEVKSLVSSLQTKYALKGYNFEATALEAAGGKVVTTGKDILVTLPAYRFTSTPETDNTWPIEVTAEDVKGNFSNREQSMVVVQAPTLSQKDSSVSLSTQTLSADSHSTATLTFIAHDAAGNPVIGLVLSTRHEGVQDITLSDWKDNGDGSYTQILTTGAMSGTLTLMPQLNGVDAAKAPAVVNIISVSSSRTHSSIKIDKDRYLSGNPIEVTVELRDENDKPVKEQKQQLNTAVSIDNVKPGVTTDWKETADGVYKATYTAYTKGSGLTAKLLMQNWNEDLHTAGFIIDANPQSAKIATLSASNNGVLANENAANTVSVNVADEGSNPINDHTVTFAVLSGSATSFNNQNTAKTDVNGLATFDLKSSKQEDNTVEVTLENGVKQTLIVSFVGDSSTAQVDLQKSKNEVVADGNDSATMTATVRDAKGNLLNDVKVTFNVNSAAAKLSQTEVNSHDGIATATLTSLKNGDYTVTASVSSGSQANQQVIFIGDQSTAALTLSVPPGEITVTDTAPQQLTATLQDKNGNPLKDKEITFSVPNDAASRFSISNSGKGMTDSNGTAIASLTGTLAGTHMITARLANSNVSDAQPMAFVADKDRAVVVLQTSKAEIIGNGVDETTLTATVKDPFDNVVKNLSVVFRTSPADTQLSLNARNTNENGIAEVTLKGTVLGVYTAEATLPNGNNDTKIVNIAPDASNAQVTLNIPAQQVVTNNSDSVQLTAMVKDPSNHPLAGITVNFTMPQDVAANFTLENNGIAITQANGEAHVTLKGKKAGTHTVTATLGNNNASDAQPVTFVADKDSAVVVLQTSKAEIIGNGVDETTLTATVKDPFDNAVKDLQVTFSTNPADTQLSQSTSNTNDSGVAEVTLKGTVLGVHTVEATLLNGNGYTTTVNIAPDASNAQVTLNIPAQQVVTNNSDNVQLTATVKDPSNHPVAGITVNFTMPQDVAANFTLENNGIAITQANGEAHVTLKGKKAGTHTVTATLGNNNTSDSQPVTFVADKTSAQVVLQMSKDEITGNGVDNATLTATVKDQFDNEVNNLPVTFSSASSGLTLTPGVSNTNESGIAQATLAGVAFGEQTVTASLANNGASDNKTVHFIGDTAAAKIIELTPVPDSIIAGTPQNSSGSVITATVVDNNGFPVKGVTVNFTSRTNSAEMTNGGQAVTNEQGKATITYTNTRSSIESGARPDTVEASLENGSSTLSTSINVNADASTAHLTLLHALFDTVSAGETTSLYIEVKDNYGNGVPQHQVTLSVSPSEGVTLSNNGIYTTNYYGYFYASFTATKAGVYQVTATLDNGDSMQQTVTYVPNVANAEITLAASKDPVIADNNDLTTLTATVADTEGNAIANTEVTFTLPEDVKANFTLSDGGKAITDAEGKAKVTLKGTKAGAHTVTALMAGGKSGQLVVNFTADTLTAQVNLNVTEDNFIANNIGMTKLQATVTDGNGNPLANEAVTFTLPADVSASFTLGQGGSAITDINGKAEVTLSGTKSGTYPVTVSVNSYGVSDTKPVTLIADAGTAKMAGFTASSSSFTASTTEGATLTASVTDAYGNPLEGIKVNFRGPATTLSNTSVETDAQGKAEILVTSTIAGTKVVTANLAIAPTEAAIRMLTVNADVDSATITSLEMPEGQVIIREPIAVKAHVDDQFGNPVADQLVTFSAEPSSFNMVISQDTVSTNRQGIAEVTMTPGRYGSYTVKASLANGSFYEKDLVVIDLRLTLTSSSPLIGVNDPSGATLTVRLTHANGAPLSHELVTFSVTPEGATLSSQTATTNTSGEAQVVLTSNKVGTYVVTASIHSGVIIQTQTTVKVTGNPSTAHVASFIADPSTLTANNSDISTLKATVEDSSGNLVEGVNVNFVLKSGSATLTSLTAVTDQNGLATTSVRGAMTGNVTVSAETNYGGAQTVDITLVAGPADASQSVLKNNRSSLKGDFTESAELYLVLHDLSGHPINVSEGLEFVQSGTNVPYVQVSAIDYSKNFSGEYKATVTGGGEGIATLIPVLNGVHQAGLNTTIEFISAGTRPMTGTVSVNGANLPAASFPSQGFTGAYYQLNNDNFAPGKTAADYAFSSTASWVGVDATGKVTFKNDGDSNTVEITATPRSGGAIYQTQVRVKGWWKDNNNIILPLSRAENYCNNEIGNGYAIPGVNLLSSGENRREIGSLFGEWGDMGHYMDADFYSEIYWSSNTAGGGRQYIVSLENGAHGSVQTSEYFHVACYKKS